LDGPKDILTRDEVEISIWHLELFFAKWENELS
jgi:hypothetical protein